MAGGRAAAPETGWGGARQGPGYGEPAGAPAVPSTSRAAQGVDTGPELATGTWLSSACTSNVLSALATAIFVSKPVHW